MGNIGSTPLQKAANEKDIGKVRRAIQQNPQSVNQQEGTMGWTALHIAAYKEADAIIRELLARGANPNLQDKENRTALHLACLKGNEACVRDLLRGYARTDIRDRNGRSPYDYAAEQFPNVAALLRGPPPPAVANSPTAAAADEAAAASSAPSAPSGLPSVSNYAQYVTVAPGHLYPDVPGVPTAPLYNTNGPNAPAYGPYAGVPQYGGAGTAAYPQPPYGAAAAPYGAAPGPYGAYAAGQQQPLYGGAGAGYAYPVAGGGAPPQQQPLPTQPQAPAKQPQQPQAAQQQAPLPYSPLTPEQQAQLAKAMKQKEEAMAALLLDDDGPVIPVRGPSPPPASPQQRPQHTPQQAQAATGPSWPPPPPPDAPPAPANAVPQAPVWSPTAAQSAAQLQGPGGPALAAASAGPSAGPAAPDLDWAPSKDDWGDEPDVRPVASAPAPLSRPGGVNPIMSARFQLEKLLGMGLTHLNNFVQAQATALANKQGQGQGPQHQHSGGSDADQRRPSGTGGAQGGSAGSASAGSMAGSVSSGRVYSYDDLRRATGGFSPLNKIGEGGYGPVYRGTLDGIPVAVKVMNTAHGALQGQREFEAEVSLLTRLHHPHILLLIGSCPDKGALVYELMPGSSLQDLLFGGKQGAPAMPWQDRVRIAAEVASALLFLHSAPEPIIHMDLKPANVLLDANRTAKLGDVGLARLIPGALGAGGSQQATQASRLVGTPNYIDPEYLQTCCFSPASDVYALGVVLLQLLTGQDSARVVSIVKAARANPLQFTQVIDPRAGPWPASEALAFADLALKCVEMRRQDRPDLRTEVLPTLMQLKQRTQLYQDQAPPPPGAVAAVGAAAAESTPAMFMCPITQDIMEDPVVAADGYTYERAAIQEWIARSPTSPLTNLPMAHRELVPNLVLRSAIREWREQQRLRQQGSGDQGRGGASAPPAGRAGGW